MSQAEEQARERLREIQQRYAGKLRENLKRILAALGQWRAANGDADAARLVYELAHQTAGSAPTMGFKRQASHCRQLEKIMKAVSATGGAPAPNLRTEIDEIAQALGRELAELERSAASPTAPSTGTGELSSGGSTGAVATAAAAGQAESPPAGPERTMTVLVIEDDAALAQYIQVLLESRHLRVFTAADGFKGVDIAETHGPNLILLDIHLPGRNGLQILQQLKTHEVLKAIPVMMMTGDSRRETVSRAASLGAVDYLVKPLDDERTLGKIQKTLQMFQQTIGGQGHKSRVKLDRRAGETTFIFTGPFGAESVRQVRDYYTDNFQMRAKRDYLILDLRYQRGFADPDLKELAAVLAILAPRKPRILAGKYYAELLALEQIDYESQLFISMEDMEKYIQSRRPDEVD